MATEQQMKRFFADTSLAKLKAALTSVPKAISERLGAGAACKPIIIELEALIQVANASIRNYSKLLKDGRCRASGEADPMGDQLPKWVPTGEEARQRLTFLEAEFIPMVQGLLVQLR